MDEPKQQRRKDEDKVRAGRLGGLKGGPERAKLLSPTMRSQIAKMGARARWGIIRHVKD